MSVMENATKTRNNDLVADYRRHVRNLDDQCSVELGRARISSGADGQVHLTRAEMLLDQVEAGKQRLKRIHKG